MKCENQAVNPDYLAKILGSCCVGPAALPQSDLGIDLRAVLRAASRPMSSGLITARSASALKRAVVASWPSMHAVWAKRGFAGGGSRG